MQKVKEYIKNNAWGLSKSRHISEIKGNKEVRLLNNDEINERKIVIEKKYNVTLPDDYCEFLSYSYGFGFQNGAEILNLEGIDRFEVDYYTSKLDDLMLQDDPSFLEEVENHVVVGKFNDGNGYALYLNERKKYIVISYIEDIPLSILELNNIWEVALYFNFDNVMFEEDRKAFYDKVKEIDDLKEYIRKDNKIEGDSKPKKNGLIAKIIKRIKTYIN